MVSDLVLLKALPEIIRQSVEAYVGCIAGAVMKDEYLAAITDAGFRDLKVVGEDVYPVELAVNDPVAKAIYSDAGIISDHAEEISGAVASIKVSAMKPD